IVGRLRQGCRDSLFIPYDASIEILVFVREAQRVADLEDGSVDIVRDVPAKVHRTFAGRRGGVDYVPAYIRPRSITLLKPDPDLGVFVVVYLLKFQAYPHSLPLKWKSS